MVPLIVHWFIKQSYIGFMKMSILKYMVYKNPYWFMKISILMYMV